MQRTASRAFASTLLATFPHNNALHKARFTSRPLSYFVTTMIPDLPGLYLAQPLSETPQGVITKDPRHAATCARVNCDNLKFGKAKDSLARRYRTGYAKDFPNNIRFTPLATLAPEDVQRAETAVKARLRDYRMRSPKNRRLEWMSGISPETAARIVFATLDAERIAYARLLS